jgi:hypothetical protein
MTIETFGLDKVRLSLERLRDVPGIADDEMKVLAREMRDLARAMAPIDYSDLHKAIQDARRGSGIRNAKGQFVKGHSTYEVFLNERTPVRDPKKKKYGTHYVSEYMWFVHEHMGWGGNDTGFMPSEKSVQHGLANGVQAGGRFLERAAEKMRDDVGKRMVNVVTKFIESLDIG